MISISTYRRQDGCTGTEFAGCLIGAIATAEDILGERVRELAAIHEPDTYIVDDSMLIPPLPPEEAEKVEITRGPNIRFLPVPDVPEQVLDAPVSLKTLDNVSTDDISPASAEFSSMRSNIPLMSQYCYHRYDPDFAARAKELGRSIIVGGENYGQGSSREHAAINPMFLGVKCVIAKSIARIHKGNLVNHGIIPMLFEDPAAYDSGLGLGILAIGLLTLLAWVSGTVTFHYDQFDWRQIPAILPMFIQCTAEEILLRGYVPAVVGKKHSWDVVCFVSGTLFIFHHILNMDYYGFCTMFCLNAFLIGVLFCLLIRTEGNFWITCGFHTGWNYMQTYLFGVTSSGNATSVGLFQGILIKDNGFFQEVYGYEGSITAAVLLAICIFCLIYVLQKKGKLEN